jgi:hypothetical protein
MNAPRAHNCEFGSSSEAIRFIARGEIVLTTSYHGAYWGMLLGRGVVIQDHGHNRFHRMWHPHKKQVTICTGKPWFKYMYMAKFNADKLGVALATCRQANLMFRDTVRMLISSSG